MIIVQRLARIPSHLRLSAITLALTTLLLNSPTFALDYSLDLLLGSEVTDNVDRLGDNQKREGIEILKTAP